MYIMTFGKKFHSKLFKLSKTNLKLALCASLVLQPLVIKLLPKHNFIFLWRYYRVYLNQIDEVGTRLTYTSIQCLFKYMMLYFIWMTKVQLIVSILIMSFMFVSRFNTKRYLEDKQSEDLGSNCNYFDKFLVSEKIWLTKIKCLHTCWCFEISHCSIERSKVTFPRNLTFVVNLTLFISYYIFR